MIFSKRIVLWLFYVLSNSDRKQSTPISMHTSPRHICSIFHLSHHETIDLLGNKAYESRFLIQWALTKMYIKNSRKIITNREIWKQSVNSLLK